MEILKKHRKTTHIEWKMYRKPIGNYKDKIRIPSVSGPYSLSYYRRGDVDRRSTAFVFIVWSVIHIYERPSPHKYKNLSLI